MREIVPIAMMGSRMQEHGRIRLGVKTAKSMKSIDTFRFTSADRAAIEQISSLYGGEPKPWSDPKASPRNQFEVITTADEIRIWLPPDALSCWYEQWGGGGCIRRCDGVTCEVAVQRGDDYESDSVACLCTAKGEMACKPYTRLKVIIPEVRFAGVWRLESKGWNVAEEMPAMEQMIQQLQARGISMARLRLAKRQTQGGRKQFVVPELLMDASPDELLAGQGSVTALPTATRQDPPALALVASSEPWEDEPDTELWTEGEPDDQVVDAEIVEEAPVSTSDLLALAVVAMDTLATQLPDSPFLEPEVLLADWIDVAPAEVERRLRGIIDGKARVVKEYDGWRVVKR